MRKAKAEREKNIKDLFDEERELISSIEIYQGMLEIDVITEKEMLSEKAKLLDCSNNKLNEIALIFKENILEIKKSAMNLLEKYDALLKNGLVEEAEYIQKKNILSNFVNMN